MHPEIYSIHVHVKHSFQQFIPIMLYHVMFHQVFIKFGRALIAYIPRINRVNHMGKIEC